MAAFKPSSTRTPFPFMNVTWESHPNNVGHENFPGCFRCHDGKHLSTDNQAIRLECNICHNIPQVAGPGNRLPPISIERRQEPESHHSTTWLAEHRFKFDTTCADLPYGRQPGRQRQHQLLLQQRLPRHGVEVCRAERAGGPRAVAPPKAPSTGVPNPIPHPIGRRRTARSATARGR